MKYINFFKSKKLFVLVAAVIIFIGVAGLFFNLQKLPTYSITINPEELLPFVSHEQVRANVCNVMNTAMFREVCREKFNQVSKEDSEKIGELFILLKKIETNNIISDYDRLLLSQVIFASLPTKNSPLTQKSKYQTIKSNLNDLITIKMIAQAKESNNNLGMGKEVFKNLMVADLEKIVGNLPKGDNAWTLSINVSKYKWVNGERQPIYSEQYGETYNPYPGETWKKTDWELEELYHVQSRVGAYSATQNITDINTAQGENEMIVYSFNIISWHSRPHTDDVTTLSAAIPEKYMTSRNNFTEDRYGGDDLLSDLLNTVSMPSREKPKDKNDKKSNKEIPSPGTPIASSEAESIGGTPGCEGWVHDPSTGLYCFDSFEQIEELVNTNAELESKFGIGVIDLVRSMEPTYPYYDVAEQEKKWLECMKQHSSEENYLCDKILK